MPLCCILLILLLIVLAIVNLVCCCCLCSIECQIENCRGMQEMTECFAIYSSFRIADIDRIKNFTSPRRLRVFCLGRFKGKGLVSLEQDMEEELQHSTSRGGLDMKGKKRDEDQMISELEVNGNRIEESGVSRTGCHGAKRHKSELVTTEKDVAAKENKLSRQDSTELISFFRGAVISYDWERAESMISEADPPSLSDFLCFLLNYVWLLWTKPALDRTEELIEMIMSSGECDFTRAAISSSRLASFFLGCQCVTLDGTATVMDDSVQTLSEMALDFIDFHSRLHANTDGENHNATLNIKLRLGVLETFLELAGDYLTGKDFTEAFDAACFLLVRFSSIFYPGWSNGTAGTVIMDFLGTLVESGAESVDQCFLLASGYGSTELVQVLLEIAQRNDVVIDVDLALDVASYYGNIDTMEFLIEEGNATALGPFVRAAARGSLHVVQWFIERGCKELEMCVALSAATSNSHLEVAAYLLPLLPQYLLSMLGISILQDAGKSEDSLKGVDFLLHSNFVGDPEATYALADLIATSDDESVVPELRSFLQEHWSEKAYVEGLEQGMKHFVNMMRVIKNGESSLLLRNLPVALRVAVAYLPVYRECVDVGGSLLSQRLRGQLVEAVWRLGNVLLVEKKQSKELLDVMEHHLRPFL